jgi:hypothetical protein
MDQMKTQVLVAALVASVALSAPSEAASKKRKKVVDRAPVAEMQKSAPQSYDVYVSGELVGRDPDPSIRAFMRRNPHIWDGPE